ncbi:MAG: hypothetical protein H6524_07760 [Actinobacteria bacterium]|jgi:hypothetical protein|nr:hypothetical protein [Actinomycetota bacterium]MCO5298777.1 hypothetical protein [Candidatus Nanopelagicales bacterium]MCB9428687.1 hypothetical protein [Actinomycetota bacterium]HPE13153.1 hypothetical protein [Actinomycetota bacterium]HPJ18149.1 hypothetical protein [Actinomycetota bacterium]
MTTVVRSAETLKAGTLRIRVRFTGQTPSAFGEVQYARAFISKNGRVRVRTYGYPSLKVTVRIRAVPKPGKTTRYKATSWQRSWKTA